jgi:hypothetical protein
MGYPACNPKGLLKRILFSSARGIALLGRSSEAATYLRIEEFVNAVRIFDIDQDTEYAVTAANLCRWLR